ncbi:RecB family nuclease [Mycolicibacterium conceptionense]|uniref:RecB family nuclease n=1 Tax=Mycolicibacterium conceptionense TaxID=451644 RepID=A0A0U1DKH9_9MYCO|nr:RecB family nuclease [Mycolicibacterium conceptionense]
MFVTDEGASGPTVIYSASDLAAAARCEYALLRSFDAQLGRGPAVSSDDELLARTAQLGGDHEQRHLEELRADSEVTVIGRPTYTVAGLTAAAHATLDAVRRRDPVIYQAAMFDGRFAGFADFLIWDGERYRLRDTKLSRSVKVEALLQLAAYADVLSAAGVPVADEVDLVLGDGAMSSYRVDELLAVYRPRRAALQSLLDGHLLGGTAVQWSDDTVRACFGCGECEQQVRATDDLFLVAGMRASQRARLIEAGVSTRRQLDDRADPVPGLAQRALTALRGQARLQVAPQPDGRPPYEVVDAQPLMLLPDPDKGDLFFDYEGDPLWTANGQDWGLEYLWGVLGAEGNFQALWAHDRASERQVLIDFLDLVRKRRKRFPKMHIYHYAPYERSTLLRLAGRYGVGENDVDDLLRTVSGRPLPRNGDTAADITAALLDLDGSYIAVHGPPGTGKTYTSAKIIAGLANEHRWRIGIVAQSHAVIEHLLEQVLDAGVPAEHVAKKRKGADPRWTPISENAYAAFIADHPGCVIGGTAWDFANEGRVPRQCLDLLVIEEAGQFNLANTIAVAPAARNLLLLGDPQQLPQVCQGTHPAPVDDSALGWLVEGAHTLPVDRGYFLDCSFRMHPAVCAPVSRLSYDGRLQSHEKVSAARKLDGIEPGVRTLEVAHLGNSTDSPEEAAAIVAAITGLLGTIWTDEHGSTPLDQEHFLVVTPYNAQVTTVRRALDAAGLTEVQAGTVDKFQGRQAPVVFVSMTASSAADVPRGIGFLLNRNRLNVAISRAKYVAYIVRSPQLTDYLPAQPDSLIALGAFLALTNPVIHPSGD